MSWMGEIAIMIQEASEVGVKIELSDFTRVGNDLYIDGMIADDWFEAVIRDTDTHDRLEDFDL